MQPDDDVHIVEVVQEERRSHDVDAYSKGKDGLKQSISMGPASVWLQHTATREKINALYAIHRMP